MFSEHKLSFATGCKIEVTSSCDCTYLLDTLLLHRQHFSGCNYRLERNSASHAVRRKRPRDLLYFCKRFRLHVGKTPIDSAR